MKEIIYTLLFCLFITNTQAQEFHRCYTDQYVNYLEQKSPGTKDIINETFQRAKNFNNSRSTNPNEDSIFRFPVVVHIVYNDPEENIHDSLVYNQIRVLNEDFRRRNADTTNTRAIFRDRAADVGFEFHLATIDPDGNPTTGITRTFTDITSFVSGFLPSLDDADRVKYTETGGITAWDTDTYVNIWVCNLGGALLGYAYPPLGAPNWPPGTIPSDPGLWGVAVSHEVFGYRNPLSQGTFTIADRGRTAVHEFGHFMGIRHIWGDAGGLFGSDCNLSFDDGIDDTPHMGSNSQNQGCDFNKNTCNNAENPDEPDMPENYMDYSTEACQNMFTNGQKEIMRNMAVVGRPLLPRVLKNQFLILNLGEYVVINNTDTFEISDPISFNVAQGDLIMFLNLNDGFNYTITEDGEYKVVGQMIELTCTGEAKIIASEEEEESPTSIEKLDNSSVIIFPNPIENTVNIKSETPYDLVEFYSIDGKKVKQFSTKNGKSIQISNLESGIYFINIKNKEKLISIKKVSIIN